MSNKNIHSAEMHRLADAHKCYRIKPDIVEPRYYYQYEKLCRECITISEYLSETQALKENFLESSGWFKIEASKREWEH